MTPEGAAAVEVPEVANAAATEREAVDNHYTTELINATRLSIQLNAIHAQDSVASSYRVASSCKHILRVLFYTQYIVYDYVYILIVWPSQASREYARTVLQ